MKTIKIMIFVFLVVGGMVPLVAYEAQIEGGSSYKSGQEHIDTAEEDEREKKDNGQQEQVKSDEKYEKAVPPVVITGAY